MKRTLNSRAKFTFLNLTLFIFFTISVQLLVGCGNSGLDGDPILSDTSSKDERGQEVASSETVIEEFATLPPPIIAEASNTPVPATNTPQHTATPESTKTQEATEIPPTQTQAPIPSTNTPQPVQPTSPPPPTATAEPSPPPPVKGANGLVASHFALQDRSQYSPGGSIWFEFTVSNNTGDEVPYNALGVMPKKDGVDRFEWYQQTYGGKNSTIKEGGLTWEDRIKLPEPGDYSLRLVMCFDGFDNCLQGGGTWHTMSDEIGIKIN